MEALLLLVAQVDTSTAPVSIGEGAQSIPQLISAFSLGILEGLAALFATLFLVTRVTGLREWLATTPADWVVPLVRAVCVLGGGLVTGLLVPPGGWAAGLGGLVGAVPVAWVFIARTIQEVRD